MMGRTINQIVGVWILFFLFVLVCGYNNICIASDEISDIDPNVVEKPKSVINFDYDTKILNCSPGKLEHSVTTSSLTMTKVDFSGTQSGGGSVGVDISVFRADLEGAIKKGYQKTFEQSKKEEYSVTKEIPPWEGIKIMLRYSKKIFESEISYKKGKKEFSVPYKYIVDVPVPKTIKLENIECSGRPTSVDIHPGYKKLEVGDKFQLKAELLDNKNNSLDEKSFTWKTSNSSVASVSKDGVVSARSEGKVKITATAKDITGKATIRVKQTVRQVIIKPPEATILYGANISLEPKVMGSNDVQIDKSVKWSSSNKKIVYVSKKGIAESRWIGTAKITANCEGIKGVSQITVNPPYIPYPEYNIRIIVPSYPGKGSDIMGRFIYRFLKEEFSKNGINITVWNMPGERGRVGWKKALSYDPDGYTLAIYNKNLPLVGNPGLSDFYPIAIFAKSEKYIYGLLAHKATSNKRIAVLEHAIKNITHNESFNKRIQKVGLKVYFVSSIEFTEEVKKFLNEQKR
jgi:uncharacterized protein YjdB